MASAGHGRGRLAAAEHAVAVHVQHLVPVLVVHLPQRAHQADVRALAHRALFDDGRCQGQHVAVDVRIARLGLDIGMLDIGGLERSADHDGRLRQRLLHIAGQSVAELSTGTTCADEPGRIRTSDRTPCNSVRL